MFCNQPEQLKRSRVAWAKHQRRFKPRAGRFEMPLLLELEALLDKRLRFF